MSEERRRELAEEQEQERIYSLIHWPKDKISCAINKDLKDGVNAALVYRDRMKVALGDASTFEHPALQAAWAKALEALTDLEPSWFEVDDGDESWLKNLHCVTH